MVLLKKLAKPIALLTLAVTTACNATTRSSEVPAINFPNVGMSRPVSHLEAGHAIPACTERRPAHSYCLALVRAGGQNVDDGGAGPGGGFAPSQLQAAYNLPSSSEGSGEVVATVDAFDNPNVAADLAYYRSYFGLPKAKFTKYNWKGQKGDYPVGNTGWGIEIDLDVEMISASCPNCTIYLIEAHDQSSYAMDAGEAEAVKLGAHVVSNSYTYVAQCGCQAFLESPGVTYLASAGDHGYGTGYRWTLEPLSRSGERT